MCHGQLGTDRHRIRPYAVAIVLPPLTVTRPDTVSRLSERDGDGRRITWPFTPALAGVHFRCRAWQEGAVSAFTRDFGSRVRDVPISALAWCLEQSELDPLSASNQKLEPKLAVQELDSFFRGWGEAKQALTRNVSHGQPRPRDCIRQGLVEEPLINTFVGGLGNCVELQPLAIRGRAIDEDQYRV